MDHCTEFTAAWLRQTRAYFRKVFPRQPERQEYAVLRLWQLQAAAGARYSRQLLLWTAKRDAMRGRPFVGDRRPGRHSDAMQIARLCGGMEGWPANGPGPATLAHLRVFTREIYSIARSIPHARRLIKLVLAGETVKGAGVALGMSEFKVRAVFLALRKAVLARKGACS